MIPGVRHEGNIPELRTPYIKQISVVGRKCVAENIVDAMWVSYIMEQIY